jgi:hypothetical protein
MPPTLKQIQGRKYCLSNTQHPKSHITQGLFRKFGKWCYHDRTCENEKTVAGGACDRNYYACTALIFHWSTLSSNVRLMYVSTVTSGVCMCKIVKSVQCANM